MRWADNPYETGTKGNDMATTRDCVAEAQQVEQIQLYYQPGTSPDRGIRPDIAAYFGVRISPQGDRVFYPVSTRDDGRVTGYKVRVLPKQFLTLGDCGSAGKSGEPAFPFGWYAAIHSNSPRLIIVEGEEDTLAAFQAIWDYQAGSEYQGKAPAIIAVPAGNLAHIKRVVDKLDRFREIVICMDSDEAGKKGKENLLKVLPADKVKVVDLPMKDASEMLVAGKGRELAEHLLFRGQEYKPDALITVGEIMEEVLTPPEYGWDFPWQPLTEMTYGIRRGLGYAIGAGVAAGKTHLCHEIAVHLIRQECTVACLMLEETAAEAVKAMAGLLVGKVFNRPGVPVDAEELRNAADKIGKSLILAKDGKVQDVSEALQWVRYAVMLHGADVVIIDPLSALVDHLSASEANTAINTICGELEILSQEMGFAWIITSHLNPPKYGPPHEAGGRVSLRDFTGSRGLMRKASFAFGVERNSETADPELRMINRVSLLKSRNGNPSATAELWLRFNPDTGSSRETVPPEGGTLVQKEKEPSAFVGGREEGGEDDVPW